MNDLPNIKDLEKYRSLVGKGVATVNPEDIYLSVEINGKRQMASLQWIYDNLEPKDE